MRGYIVPPSVRRGLERFSFSVLNKNCDFLKLHFINQSTLQKQNLNSTDKKSFLITTGRWASEVVQQ